MFCWKRDRQRNIVKEKFANLIFEQTDRAKPIYLLCATNNLKRKYESWLKYAMGGYLC